MEKLFWEISDPKSPKYAQYLTVNRGYAMLAQTMARCVCIVYTLIKLYSMFD
jgi:hypothetical protein